MKEPALVSRECRLDHAVRAYMEIPLQDGIRQYGGFLNYCEFHRIAWERFLGIKSEPARLHFVTQHQIVRDPGS